MGGAFATSYAGIAERADLAVVAPRVVDADQRAAVDEELVELLLKLVVGQRLRVARLLRLLLLGLRLRRLLLLLLCRAAGRRRIQLVQHLGVVAPQRRRIEAHEHLLRRAHQHHLAFDGGLQRVEVRVSVARVGALAAA